jgi:hypothetical protein
MITRELLAAFLVLNSVEPELLDAWIADVSSNVGSWLARSTEGSPKIHSVENRAGTTAFNATCVNILKWRNNRR